MHNLLDPAILFFVFGILIASKYTYFESFLGRHPGFIKVLWPAAFALLAVPYATGYLEFCYALGALLLIVLCLQSLAARRFLGRPALLWLGKISYSLYLSHQIVLIALVHLLYEKLPIGVILLIVLIVSLPIAELLNRTVELPSSALGKRMVKAGSPAQ